MTHEYYMSEAIKEAYEGINHGHGGPFGAVIVDKDGEIIGRGHNQVMKQHDPTCHGEVMAIRDACARLGTHDLTGCRIYTTGDPCPMCYGAILWANITEIYFGCSVRDTEEIGFRDAKFYEMSTREGKAKLVKQLSREECWKLYQDYLKINGPANY